MVKDKPMEPLLSLMEEYDVEFGRINKNQMLGDLSRDVIEKLLPKCRQIVKVTQFEQDALVANSYATEMEAMLGYNH